MTVDKEKLQALAEEAISPSHGYVSKSLRGTAFASAADPATILALLAELATVSEAYVRAGEREHELRLEMSSLRQNAKRYQWLRDRDVDTIRQGGVFAGVTPENLVINGEDLDRHIDAAMAKAVQS